VKKLNVEPSNVLSLGDREIDIIASQRAGVSSGACLWNSDEVEQVRLANPDFVFSSPKELFDFFEFR